MTGWGNVTATEERRILVAERNRAVLELDAARVRIAALERQLSIAEAIANARDFDEVITFLRELNSIRADTIRNLEARLRQVSA